MRYKFKSPVSVVYPANQYKYETKTKTCAFFCRLDVGIFIEYIVLIV